MASKHRGSSKPGAGAGQSRLLQLMRRHGYAEELPPSTVSWLDSRPVFRWLAEHLSDDNFVSPEAQRLYDSIQLQAEAGGASGAGAAQAAGSGAAAARAAPAGGAQQAQAQLMSAMGISSGSGSGSDDEDAGGRDGGWDEPQGCDELQLAIEEQQAYLDLLQQHQAAVATASRRLAAPAAGARGATQQRRAVLGSLRAAALRAAQGAAAEAGGEVDTELGRLADELEGWAQLADAAGAGGEEWMLAAVDAGAYAAREAEMQELISRGMRLVSAAAGVMPPEGADGGGAGSGADSDGGDADDARGGGGGSGAKAPGGGNCGDARRWRDQERRNEGLREELARQRVAFKDAYDNLMAAAVQQAGAEGALSAVESLIQAERHRRGAAGTRGPGAAAQLAAAAAGGGRGGAAAAAAGEGVAAILEQAPQLRREAEALERERLVMQEVQLPALHAALARLNDTHVLEGDYDRQLAKMRVAHARKRALIETLLDAAARHAALREVQAAELGRLRELSSAAEAARALLAAAGAATARREAAAGGAAAAAAAAAGRSSIAPEDAYLARLNQVLRPAGAAEWEAAQAGGEPGGGGAAGGGGGGGFGAQGGALTPRGGRGTAPAALCTAKDLRAGLSALGAGLRAGGAELEGGLFAELPRRLADVAAAERELHGVAFPGGGGDGNGGGAAAPALTGPALAGAMRELEGLNHSVGAAINRLLAQQADWAAVQRQRAREHALERRAMALMFTDPPRLAAAAEELRGRVAALAAGGGGGGGEGGGA
ncbi:MAG: hypothetical protein J3K34DRAFT_512435 [Monoraphidium minutum]|nr:MAG: hypothetical protein J3K34DRAFT_512435 [Monoraphidium minutum]